MVLGRILILVGSEIKFTIGPYSSNSVISTPKSSPTYLNIIIDKPAIFSYFINACRESRCMLEWKKWTMV